MIINLRTGKPASPVELRAMRQRAREIVASPYAAPELLEWVIEVYPEAFAEVIQDRGRKK